MQLAEMGFPLEACRKAVYYTGNMGPEMAFNWIIAHMEEPGRGETKHRNGPLAPMTQFYASENTSENHMRTRGLNTHNQQSLPNLKNSWRTVCVSL